MVERLIWGHIRSSFVVKRLVHQDLGRDMLVYCGMEMNHLASFLPLSIRTITARPRVGRSPASAQYPRPPSLALNEVGL